MIQHLPMGSYSLLHKNQFGYVIHCRSCRKAQITFGTVIITLTEEDFIHSKKCFTELARKYLDFLLIDPDKKIVIETVLQGFSLFLTTEELQLVSDLFTQSALMMEVNQVLNDPGTNL